MACEEQVQWEELTPRPEFLEAWLALTSVNYHRNVIDLDTSKLMVSADHFLSVRVCISLVQAINVVR